MTTTYWTSIDECGDELETTEYQIEGEWDHQGSVRIGEYEISEYRSSRNHLGIEVSGPDREKTREIAASLMALYWAD